MKKRSTISILMSILLLIIGSVGFYFLNTHYNKLEVKASSTIIQSLPSGDHGNKKSSQPKDLKTIIHETQKDVVQVTCQTDQGTVLGSGFLYNKQGDIITNAHVVAGAKSITIQTADTQKYKGVLIGVGDLTDIAVIRVEALKNKEPLKLATTRRAEVGDKILALGSPLGLQNTVTTGIVSGLNRDLNIDPYVYHHVYQISAPITHGNSGGPLIDQATGEVLGINSAGTDSGTIGFSIPIIDVYQQLTDWSANPSEIKLSHNLPNSDQSNTASNNLTGADLQKQAEYLIGYYYDSISSGDYVTAYALLGSDWQNKQSYQDFRKGFIHTMGVTITKQSSKLSGDQVIVTDTIQAQERTKDQTTTTSLYKCVYTVGYEDDQLRIISGSSDKVN